MLTNSDFIYRGYRMDIENNASTDEKLINNPRGEMDTMASMSVTPISIISRC